MGLLNLFNKKKQPKDTDKIVNNIEKSENQTEEQDETNSDSKFRFVIQDIFKIKGKGCVVVGMVENYAMHKGDAVYILKSNGPVLKTTITGMELYKAGLIETAEPGQNIGVFLQNLEPDQLNKGDIIVNASDSVFSESDRRDESLDDKQLEKVFENDGQEDRENGIVTESRRNELGNIVFQTEIKSDMLHNLTIQECTFILKSLDHFNEKSALPNYEDNRKVVYTEIIEKVKTSSKLYVLFDKATGQPFIGTDLAEIYSTKHWADAAVNHYKEQYRQLYVEEFEKDGNDKIKCNIFAFLFFLGMENVIIDNGAYSLQLKRAEILPPPDWSDLPPISVPVTNPSLRLAVNLYLDEARWAVDYPDREENVKNLESKMLSELRNGKFLIPMKQTGMEKTGDNEAEFKKGGTLSFAIISNNEQKPFVPLFTDWLEFEKVYNKDEWNGMILTVKDALSIAKDKEGMVINPFGENLIISNALAGEIFKDLLSDMENK